LTESSQRQFISILRSWAETRQEPSWLIDQRTHAALNMPPSSISETGIEEWPILPTADCTGRITQPRYQELRDLGGTCTSLHASEALPAIETFANPLLRRWSTPLATRALAIWEDGLFLHVPAQTETTLSLDLFSHHTGEANVLRSVIVLEPGCRVQIVEGCIAPRYINKGPELVTVELFLHEQCYVEYFSLNHRSGPQQRELLRSAWLANGAHLRFTDCTLTSDQEHHDSHLNLQGDDSSVDWHSFQWARASGLATHTFQTLQLGNRSETSIQIHNIASDQASSHTDCQIDLESQHGTATSKISSATLSTGPSATATHRVDGPNAKDEFSCTEHPHQSVPIGAEDPLVQSPSTEIQDFVRPSIRRLPEDIGMELSEMVRLGLTGSIG